MEPFWRIISLFISLLGFLVVGGLLLLNGEDLLWSVVKSVIVFAALWFAQGLLRGLLALAADSEAGRGQSGPDAT